MMNELGLSDLIKKYQKSLGANPSSRVFAPLAECYRRAGMLNEALDVLKEGIKRNPDYLLGYLGLAQCYYDLKQYQAGYTLLRPYIESNKDNLKLQRVFASLCLKLDFHEEALDAYKYILFMNPADGEAADYIAEFEDTVTQKKITQKKMNDSFSVSKLHSEKIAPSQDDIDEWVAVDLSSYQGTSAEVNEKKSHNEKDNELKDQWKMEKQAPLELELDDENLDGPVPVKSEQSEAGEERKFFVIQNEAGEARSSQPLITHTLVDLYCAQGHFEKAHNLLLKILELNPTDEKTKLKLQEIVEFMPDLEETKSLTTKTIDSEYEDESEEYSEEESEDVQQAHERLMMLVETKVQGNKEKQLRENLEEKLWLFHDKVKQKAKEKSTTTQD